MMIFHQVFQASYIAINTRFVGTYANTIENYPRHFGNRFNWNSHVTIEVFLMRRQKSRDVNIPRAILTTSAVTR